MTLADLTCLRLLTAAASDEDDEVFEDEEFDEDLDFDEDDPDEEGFDDDDEDDPEVWQVLRP